ncbi:MAG: hypothetical protein V1668_02865 [Patescibacteria group bacterium]
MIIDKISAEYPDECNLSCLAGGKCRGIILVTTAGFHHGHALYVIVEDDKGLVSIGCQPMDTELTEQQVLDQVRSFATHDIFGKHFNLTFRRAPVIGIVKAGRMLVGLLKKGESILCQTETGQVITRKIARIIVLHSSDAKTPGR